MQQRYIFLFIYNGNRNKKIRKREVCGAAVKLTVTQETLSDGSCAIRPISSNAADSCFRSDSEKREKVRLFGGLNNIILLIRIIINRDIFFMKFFPNYFGFCEIFHLLAFKHFISYESLKEDYESRCRAYP